MDLNIIDKITLFFNLNFNSFLAIEELLIFILILSFLIINLKYKNNKVKIFIPFLLLFIVSLAMFLYGSSILYVLEEIVKGIIYAIYFPNIIFYIITVIISFSIMIYTILSNKLTNKEKIINYLLCGIHLYLFILFITNCLDLNVSLVRPSRIYKHDELYVLVQSCQLVFVVNIIYQSVKMLVRKLKNKSKNDIMDRK
ncbi:unknown [Clostridium sp. CAG:451]|jgi:uncharacterized membrane protein|nr:unknown [Clostridium sp. CAG:451]